MNETPQTLTIEEKDETQQTKPQNLEAFFRDSIFGEDFRNYDEKIENITQEIINTKQQIVEVETRLLKEINDVKAQYGDIPDNLAQRVDNRIDELISRSENDIEKLSMLINELATDFQSKIDTLQNTTQTDRQVLADALITIGTQLKKEI